MLHSHAADIVKLKIDLHDQIDHSSLERFHTYHNSDYLEIYCQ
jgi:hypothetical protein